MGPRQEERKREEREEERRENDAARFLKRARRGPHELQKGISRRADTHRDHGG